MEDFRVKKMFESIAFSYDFQNSVLSLWQDARWRRILAKSLKFESGPLVLDLATGTAEVAMEICGRHAGARVIGVDFSPGMLSIGRKKIKAMGLENRIHLLVGDARRLPVGSVSFDCATISFGIRNIEERRVVLDEMRQALKEGGQLLIMEFDFPDVAVLNRLYGIYFNHILPPLGNWLSRTDYAYSYLVESIRGFPTDAEFRAEIAEAGFEQVKSRSLTFGIAKIYSGIKRSS
ncbi:MAG: ubiquinone/menaquinone biosynthesis methyltransferase [Deltaproteobacteria bacterium]|nr:ubiquinone/menaquinone biosynthesis methyltransferase [Deltaproteobacteria bacterium]